MDLANKELSSEAKLDLKLEGGKLLLVAAYDGKGGDAKIELALEPDYFIDKLAGLIPGQVDDAIFAVIKGALKAV